MSHNVSNICGNGALTAFIYDCLSCFLYTELFFSLIVFYSKSVSWLACTIHRKDMEPFISGKKVCSRMRLWEFESMYVFEPLEENVNEFLAVNKRTGELRLIHELPDAGSRKFAQKQIIFGFLGILRLLSEVHALVVTSREYVGDYLGAPVYKILSMKFLHCHSLSRTLSQGENDDETHLRSLLYSLETSSGLYMSYDADLTHSRQSSMSIQKGQPLWRQVESRFVWNSQLLESISDMKFDSFVLPVVQGSFHTLEMELCGTLVKVCIVARRCVRRIGTRMWRRGANLDGDVANFVETEQILVVNGRLASHVQVRGSIPVLWQQVVNLKYKPKIELVNWEESPKVAKLHFQDLSNRYGSVIAVDLVNQHGGEAILGKAYANVMHSNIISESIRYVPFDFHHMCGNVKFERLSILYDQIREELDKQSYFLMEVSGNVLETQKGIVRTNCIDCLDRTNVTQSLIGRRLLENQLQRLGIFGQSDKISSYMEFDTKFKAMWADHGDDISIQYSGTCALKGDFVRFGKRTISGILKDGYSSLARYYYNNLHDGIRQDALDLAVGHYAISRGFSFREKRKVPRILRHVPLVSLLILIGMLFTISSMRQAREDVYQMLYAVICGSLTLGIMLFVRSNGREFTSQPRLCELH